MQEIKITGLSELCAKLQELPARIERNIMRGALRAAAGVVRDEARKRAPVSNKEHWLGKGFKKVLIKPGSLKKAIKVRQGKTREKGAVLYQVYISKKIWYGRFVEMGTSKQPGHPYLRPAFDAQKERALAAMQEYIIARIDKEIRG